MPKYNEVNPMLASILLYASHKQWMVLVTWQDVNLDVLLGLFKSPAAYHYCPSHDLNLALCKSCQI